MTQLVFFLDHCFCSMEVDLVRTQLQRLVSLPMRSCLLEARREAELKKYWKLLQKKDAKVTLENLEKLPFERMFLSSMIQKFRTVLYTVQEKEWPPDIVDFVERFLMLIICPPGGFSTQSWMILTWLSRQVLLLSPRAGCSASC